jgi:hypothetical protein
VTVVCSLICLPVYLRVYEEGKGEAKLQHFCLLRSIGRPNCVCMGALGLGPLVGSCEHGNESLPLIKGRQHLVTQERLCFMVCVSITFHINFFAGD